MRKAFARAGLWFFGTIIAIVVFGGESYEDSKASDGEIVAGVLCIAVVVAGTIFFYTWYTHEQDLEYREHHQAFMKSEDEDAQ